MNETELDKARMLSQYFGFKIYATNNIRKQVQARTHRKRRINKKWLKRYGYKSVPDDSTILIFGDRIYATPRAAKKIAEKVQKEANHGSDDVH